MVMGYLLRKIHIKKDEQIETENLRKVLKIDSDVRTNRLDSECCPLEVSFYEKCVTIGK